MDYIVEIKRDNSTTVTVDASGKIKEISPFYKKFLGMSFIEFQESISKLKPKIRKL